MSKKLILAVSVLILEEILAFNTLYSTGSDNEPIVGLKIPHKTSVIDYILKQSSSL